jgi:hypothetical protein
VADLLADPDSGRTLARLVEHVDRILRAAPSFSRISFAREAIVSCHRPVAASHFRAESSAMAETVRRVDHRRVSAKLDCYEIRFRLAGYEALLPVFGLLLLAFGIFVPGSLAQRASFIACGGLFIVPYVILLASRPIVFRADHAGITLGPELSTLQFSSSGVIGWADIDTVILYKRVGLSNQRGKSPGTYIEIVLDEGEPAPSWATRRINTWRLDRQLLAAVAAAAAPDVPVVDTTADRKLWRRP